MNCPKCHSDSKVLETRTMDNGLVRRRRECLACLFRFPTHEVYVVARKKIVQKAVAKPREEKKIPPLVKKVEGKRRPEPWSEIETPGEELPHEFSHLGTSVYGHD